MSDTLDIRGVYIEKIASPIDNPFLTEKARDALAEHIAKQIDVVVQRAITCGAPKVAIVVNNKRYGQIIDLHGS
jgi:hypothetical protein